MGCQATKAVKPTESVKWSLQNRQAERKPAAAFDSVTRPPKLEPLTKNIASQQYSKSARQIRVGKNLLAGMTCQNLGGVDLMSPINQKNQAYPEKLLGSSLDAIPELFLSRPSLANQSIRKDPKVSELQQDGIPKSNYKKVNMPKLGLQGLDLQQSSVGDDVLQSPKKKLVATGLQTSVVTPNPSDLAESLQSKSKRVYARDKVGMSTSGTSTGRPNRNFRVVLQRASSAERKQRGPVKAVNIDSLLQDFDREDHKSSVNRVGRKEQTPKHHREQIAHLAPKQHKSTPRILRKHPKPQQKLGSCAAEFGEGNQASISDCLVSKGFKEDQCPKSGELADTSTAFPSCQPKLAAFAEISIVLKSVTSKSEEDSEGSPRVAKQSPQLQKAHMDTDKSEDSAVLEMSVDKVEVRPERSQVESKARDLDCQLLDRLERDSAGLPLKRGNFSLAAIEPGRFNGLKRKCGGRIVKFNSSRQEQTIGNGFRKIESARMISSPRKLGFGTSQRVTSQRKVEVSGMPRLAGFHAFLQSTAQRRSKLSIDQGLEVEEEQAPGPDISSDSKENVSFLAPPSAQGKLASGGTETSKR